MVAYNSAKAGIEALTRILALEGRDLGIRVNAIAPGLVDTASNIALMKPKDLKRWTKREDIAETVVFLASPAATGITGQVIAVTGGDCSANAVTRAASASNRRLVSR
jgi:NAD(P)-dependent dehydrogenase (short-subunit alcohol dehydrogenase family)